MKAGNLMLNTQENQGELRPGLPQRRSFFRIWGWAGLAAAMVSVWRRFLVVSPLRNVAIAAPAGEVAEENVALRMQQDLQKALRKPPAERRWGMVIDMRKCIGCHGCEVACIAENNLPPGVTYRTVREVEWGDFPDVRRAFMPTNCFQCENPPCVEAATKILPGSMSVRPDGVVAIDGSKMQGQPVFEAARKACPYTGALYFDQGGYYTEGTPAVQPYEQRPTVEYGQPVSRQFSQGRTRKCHFCLHKIEAGALPACVSTCTGQAMHFGDLNDPESYIAQLLAKSKQFRLGEAQNTRPRVIYISDDIETCRLCHE
jgi:tetrathionate reductase subunit B